MITNFLLITIMIGLDDDNKILVHVQIWEMSCDDGLHHEISCLSCIEFSLKDAFQIANES